MKLFGLKARGGFNVDIAWEHGQLKNATIQPSVTGTKTVRYKNKTLKVDTNKPLFIQIFN